MLVKKLLKMNFLSFERGENVKMKFFNIKNLQSKLKNPLETILERFLRSLEFSPVIKYKKVDITIFSSEQKNWWLFLFCWNFRDVEKNKIDKNNFLTFFHWIAICSKKALRWKRIFRKSDWNFKGKIKIMKRKGLILQREDLKKKLFSSSKKRIYLLKKQKTWSFF